METVFKINDRVYDGILQLWGTITAINISSSYPITVDFGNAMTETYTIDGRRWMYALPTLSFTFYDLVNSGFSQVRPQPEIKKDQLVYVRPEGYDVWEMRHFSHFDKDGKLHFFCGQQKSTETKRTYKAFEYSFKNPLI